MAVLRIEVEASGGVIPPTPILAIDGWVIHLIEGVGQVKVAGSCGDDSLHVLSYDIAGPEGETLEVTILCGGDPIREVKAKIFPGAIRDVGIAEFRL